MHLYTDKKKYILFLILLLLFLSSINSQLFVKKKEFFYNLKFIEVKGVNNLINKEIEKELNFLKNTNIFFIDKEILKDQINKYDFIENFNVIKLYPSKIILELQKTEFLAQTIRDNKTFIIGSNNKFININKFTNYKELPVVFGKFTTEKFLVFKKIINESDLNYKDIKEIFFYPSGRIDIKNKDNILIKFPIENIEKSLNILSKIIKNKNLNNKVIDLRISNQIILSNE